MESLLFYHGDPKHHISIYPRTVKRPNSQLWDYYDFNCPCDNKKLLASNQEGVSCATCECLGHPSDPASSEKDKEKFVVTVDYSKVPELGGFALRAKKNCEEWYPLINTILNGSPINLPFKEIIFCFDPEEHSIGPFYAIKGETVKILISKEKAKDDGIVIQRLAYTMQNSYSGADGWVHSAISHLVRYYYFEPLPELDLSNPNASFYTKGPIGASFLNFVENMDKSYSNILLKMREAVKEWKNKKDKPSWWDAAPFFEKLTGYRLITLWNKYLEAHNIPTEGRKCFPPMPSGVFINDEEGEKKFYKEWAIEEGPPIKESKVSTKATTTTKATKTTKTTKTTKMTKK